MICEIYNCAQIPETDERCRWDWRSVRCEPACECNLHGQFGDYHLGRACRIREERDESCVPVDPASIWQDTPVTRRVLSLVTQTADIVKLNLKTGWDKAMSKASRRATTQDDFMHLSQSAAPKYASRHL